VIGQGELARGRAVLPDGLDAGDGRQLAEPRVVEGVGRVVGHLGRDLRGRRATRERDRRENTRRSDAAKASASGANRVFKKKSSSRIQSAPGVKINSTRERAEVMVCYIRGGPYLTLNPSGQT